MGHERLGVLPKSKAWRLIVAEMAGFALGSSEIYSIAKNTLQQVQKQFSNLENDPSIKSAFEFLLQVSYAFQKNDPIGYLSLQERLIIIRKKKLFQKNIKLLQDRLLLMQLTTGISVTLIEGRHFFLKV